MTTIPSKNPVLGIGVSATSYGEVLRVVRGWIAERASQPRARYTAILNVHSVMTGVLDPAFRSVLNAADLATSDGMPLVWASRWLGARTQRRVYGPDLMLALCGQATREQHRIFLYGGRDETLALLCDRLRSRFPGICVAGAFAPPFRPPTPEEDASIIARIRASQADLVFVGTGCPKQERWMAEHRDALPGVVMFGVGAAFDFHCGRVRQAPSWMQRAGLEWLFRFAMEPARLWKRYALLNPLFVVLWGLQMTGLLRYSLPRPKEQNS